MKNKNYIILLLLFINILLNAQNNNFDPTYKLLHSHSFIQDKNFYLFTLLEKIPAAKTVIEKDETLQTILKAQQTRIQESLNKCDTTVTCWLNAYALTADEQQKIGNRLAELCKKDKNIQNLVQNHLRPSGMFMKYAAKSDAEMLQLAWTEACGGFQYIIDSYAFGKRGRYPNIDSVSYDANSLMYKRYLMASGHFLAEDINKWNLFFQPSLAYVLTLLDMNNRDEAARHEPMEYLENQKALEYIPTINWDK